MEIEILSQFKFMCTVYLRSKGCLKIKSRKRETYLINSFMISYIFSVEGKNTIFKEDIIK